MCLLKLYLLIMLVKEFVLRKMIVAVFLQPGLLSEFLFPVRHFGSPGPALGKIGVKNGVYYQL